LHLLQSGNGGPIIAVQVENEYGSFGSDHNYMEQIHFLLLDAGFDQGHALHRRRRGRDCQRLACPSCPRPSTSAAATPKSRVCQAGNQVAAECSAMCGEYWDGWFDHWGGKHHTTPAAEAKELKWMLEQGYSVNLYMFHGGTSFGWMNGANIDGGKYEPMLQVTTTMCRSVRAASSAPNTSCFAMSSAR
jgi:beta-galactosidase